MENKQPCIEDKRYEQPVVWYMSLYCCSTGPGFERVAFPMTSIPPILNSIALTPDTFNKTVSCIPWFLGLGQMKRSKSLLNTHQRWTRGYNLNMQIIVTTKRDMLLLI